MTKKDYQLIADTLVTEREWVNSWDDEVRKAAALLVLNHLTDRFATRLGAERAVFDPKRFRRAAGAL